ncbi:MAG: MFS transporter [Rhodospirillales bacterium]|nr:MFS transporter [Rhodospirillales bacterium]
MTGPADAAPPELPARALFLAVVPPMILPVFLGAADPTVVATALPAIAAAFGHVRLLPWMVVANLMASTIAAPAYGRLADMFGLRRMLFAALALFLGAAVFCAFAPNLPALMAGRVLSGLGGGGLTTLCQTLIGARVPRRARGRFQGYYAACIVAGSAFGPVAGGLLTQYWGWQAIFVAYLPPGALALGLIARLPRAEEARAGGAIDIPGIALLTVFVVPFLMAIARLQRPAFATLPLTLGLAALAALAALALIRQQRAAGAAGVMAAPLLRDPSFWRADLMSACSGASLTALVTFLPLYFRVVGGAGAARSGLLLMPLTVGVSLGSVATGWLVSRTARTAIFPMLGLGFTALTLIAAAVLGPSLSPVALAWLLAAGGLTQGTAMLTAQITVQLVAPARMLGAAAGSVQLSRSLGSAFGAAAAGAVLFGLLAARDAHAAGLFAELVREGPSALAALPGPQRMAARAEIADAFRGVFLTVAVFSCTIVAMAATMRVRRV